MHLIFDEVWLLPAFLFNVYTRCLLLSRNQAMNKFKIFLLISPQRASNEKHYQKHFTALENIRLLHKATTQNYRTAIKSSLACRNRLFTQGSCMNCAFISINF